MALFELIEFNLTNVCNRACSFCPQSLLEYRELQHGIMKVSVVEAAVKFCKAHNINPVMTLCGFGEPLLNKELMSILDCLDEYRVMVFTNMDVAFKRPHIITTLDRPNVKLVMNQYDDNTQAFNDVANALQFSTAQIIKHDGLPTQRYQNRANVLSDLGIDENKKLPCHLPKNQLFIDYDGTILLCCNDWFKENKFGSIFDMNNFLIGDYHKIADQIMDKRSNYEFCKDCNMPNTEKRRAASLYP